MEVECSRTCRTCGEIRNNPDNEMFPIFQENAADPQPHELFASNNYFRDYLFSILKINIYDGMPQNVCKECNNIMQTIIKFYNQCENAQEILEKTFKFKVAPDSPTIEFLSVDKVETVISDVDNNIQENLANEELTDEDVDDDESIAFENNECITEDDSESTDSEEEREYQKRKKRKPAQTKQHLANTKINDEATDSSTISLPEVEQVCPKCKHNADSKSELIEHIIVKHPSKKCLICKKSFVAIGACNKHQRDIHARGPKYNCDTCKIVFTKKLEMRDHMFTAHGVPRYECKVCHEKFHELEKYRYHANSHKYGEFVCKLCGKSFAQPTSLRTHEKWHATTKPHLCTICGATFVYKCFLDRHIQSHSVEKLFKCNICEKAFNYQRSYNYHMKTHVGNIPRPFICDQCGKNFVTKAALKVHMRTHLDDKPFKCDLCDMSFTQNGNLNSHRSAVHGEAETPPSTDEMLVMMASPEEGLTKSKNALPFVCIVCKKGFKLAHSLVKHFKVHSEAREFRCGQCPSAFKKKKHLSNHINEVHLKIRPHHCTMCPKQFSSVTSLTIHMRWHTGEKPFTCTVCNTSFAIKKLLKNHVATHTGLRGGDYKCQLCPAEFRSYQGLSAHNLLQHKKKKESSVNKQLH